MIRVKSNVYSMDFWALDKVSWNNVSIDRIGSHDEYKETRDRIAKEKKHYQTGLLTIDIPPEKTTIDEARAYSEAVISKLHLLLAFSHGYDIPISGFSFYEVNAGRETLIAQESSIIWIGRVGTSSINIMSYGLDRICKVAMPLVSDDSFNEKTCISLALTYYNAARNNNFLDTKFIVLWLGLEAMANSFSNDNPADLVLTREEWSNIKKRCEEYLTSIGKKNVYDNLLKDISFLRNGTIKEKISYMLNHTSYQMSQYSDEIESMYNNIRVPLFHGRQIDWKAHQNKVFRLKRVMEKLILKTLGFYDNDFVHYSIKDEDLSKT
jgi:hypothetical protein